MKIDWSRKSFEAVMRKLPRISVEWGGANDSIKCDEGEFPVILKGWDYDDWTYLRHYVLVKRA